MKPFKSDGPLTTHEVGELLKQASAPTRIEALCRLSLAPAGEMFVGDLARAIGCTQPALSHHLSLLRHSGLIEPRREGKNNYYALTPAGDRLAGVVVALRGGAGAVAAAYDAAKRPTAPTNGPPPRKPARAGA